MNSLTTEFEGVQTMLAVTTFEKAGQIHDSALSDFASLFVRQPIELAMPGTTIFFAGDSARHVFRIATGNVRICRLLPDGRRMIIGFLTDRDLVGLSFRNRYMFSAEAIDEVAFTRMNKRTLEEELQRVPELRFELLSHLRDEITAAQDHMMLLSHKNAEQRLCTFLLHRVEHLQSRDGGLIDLPMVRADIADHLGMTIETVSRTLTKLVARRVLLPAEKHQFKMISRSALARAADEYAEDLEDAADFNEVGKVHAGSRSQ